MRVIGGNFKGKKISYTNSSTTRPLRDFVKENIFNILTHAKNNKLNFDKVRVLDLYSGVGSFGIECISRNVGNVVFVEKDPLAFSILQKNINDLKVNHKSKLVSQDVKKFIEKLDKKEQFDLIFFDPPYKDTTYLDIINLIKKKKIFSKNHKLIIHREKNNDEDLNKILNIDLLKNYGRSKIIFASF